MTTTTSQDKGPIKKIQLPGTYEVLHQAIRHYLKREVRTWEDVLRLRKELGREVFWERYRRRERNMVLDFNGRIYTAVGKVFERTLSYKDDGPPKLNSRVWDNSNTEVEICTAYTSVDMLELLGYHGQGLQIRAAYSTNYGEASVDHKEIPISVDGAKFNLRRGDVCIGYGPPNAGKNKLWDAIAHEMGKQNMKVILVPGFETRPFGAKSISAWIMSLDKGLETNDFVVCDGTTDLVIVGQTAKSTQGRDLEHAITLGKLFSGLAASGKGMAFLVNTMDVLKSDTLEATRRMYTGKFSFVTFSEGSPNYTHSAERGSGFGARVKIEIKLSQTTLEKTPPIRQFIFDPGFEAKIAAAADDAQVEKKAEKKVFAPKNVGSFFVSDEE